MRIVPSILAAVALLAAVPTARADEPTREPKPRFKGVEMYSWKDDKGDWKFALLNGTNRQKTEKEVKEAETVYAGEEKLVAALKLLAEGEHVFWSNHRLDGFAKPADEVVKRVKKAAKGAKLKLDVYE